MSERLVGLEPKIEFGILLSFYGALLTARQREMAILYCDEDLGIAEIARQLSVTRQCASVTLRNGLRRLRELETALGLVARYKRLEKAMRDGVEHLNQVSATPDTREALSKAKDLLNALLTEEGG